MRREKLRQFAPLDQTGADPAAPGRMGASPPRPPSAASPEDAAGVGEFRARQLRARDLLRGDLEGGELERHVEEAVATTTLERALGWARANSIFPLTFGLACCAIEMISLVTPRYDIARFGAENMRASPRQADLLILSGRVSIKMAPVVRRIYDQMLEPKWAIAMGACSSSGGMFANYAVVQGADKFMPVDVHVPGCPPRPEALISGFNKLQRMIGGNPEPGWRQRYNAIGTEEWARGGAAEPTQEERDAYTAARELTREMASAPGSDGA